MKGLFQLRIPRMGTDLRHSTPRFDSICAHPWNPWLTYPQPTEDQDESRGFAVRDKRIDRKIVAIVPLQRLKPMSTFVDNPAFKRERHLNLQSYE
jgi:hypothetical protein